MYWERLVCGGVLLGSLPLITSHLSSHHRPPNIICRVHEKKVNKNTRHLWKFWIVNLQFEKVAENGFEPERTNPASPSDKLNYWQGRTKSRVSFWQTLYCYFDSWLSLNNIVIVITIEYNHVLILMSSLHSVSSCSVQFVPHSIINILCL